MTNVKDRLALELQAVNTQLYRLGKKKKQLNAQILALASEEWVNNQQHMVEDVIAGDRYCMKLQWRQSKEKVVPLHYQKHITPLLGGVKFVGHDVYVDNDLVIHTARPTRENTLDLIIPPLPVFE